MRSRPCRALYSSQRLLQVPDRKRRASTCTFLTVILTLLVIAVFELLTPEARAGELLKSRKGANVHWERNEIVLVPVPVRAARSVTTELLVRELREAAGIWNRSLGSCTAPRFRVMNVDDTAADRVGRNGQSIVIFQMARRCANDVPGDVDCYASDQNAITHLYPEEDGRVDEADIEINGIDVDWEASSDRRESTRLRAVLVHELGHVLALEHSCGAPGTRSCTSAEARASVMYPDSLASDRPLVLVPGDDELRTLRRAYGERAGCSCDAGPDARSSSSFAVAFVAMWFAARLRRRAVVEQPICGGDDRHLHASHRRRLSPASMEGFVPVSVEI